MEIYTIQLAKWRLLEGTDIELVNITLGSGDPTFAPSPALLADYKAGRASQDVYLAEFYRLCRMRYRHNPGPWHALLAKEKIAVACYCPKDGFCHRHPFVDIMIKIGASQGVIVEYCGEITL